MAAVADVVGPDSFGNEVGVTNGVIPCIPRPYGRSGPFLTKVDRPVVLVLLEPTYIFEVWFEPEILKNCEADPLGCRARGVEITRLNGIIIDFQSSAVTFSETVGCVFGTNTPAVSNFRPAWGCLFE